jgi:hypothetical protein
MKIKKLKLFAIFLFLLPLCVVMLGAGCEKDEESDIKDAHGLVMYYGDPAVDGCGWIIKINNSEYSPINLDSKFHEDSLEIILDYDTLISTWNCGWRQPGYQQIQIIAINTKN